MDRINIIITVDILTSDMAWQLALLLHDRAEEEFKDGHQFHALGEIVTMKMEPCAKLAQDRSTSGKRRQIGADLFKDDRIGPGIPERMKELEEDRPFYISHGDAVKELNKTCAALALTEKRLAAAMEGLEEIEHGPCTDKAILTNRNEYEEGYSFGYSQGHCTAHRETSALATTTIAKVKEVVG